MAVQAASIIINISSGNM